MSSKKCILCGEPKQEFINEMQFVRVPRDKKRRKLWAETRGRNSYEFDTLPHHSFVCQKHFQHNDLIFHGDGRCFGVTTKAIPLTTYEEQQMVK